MRRQWTAGIGDDCRGAYRARLYSPVPARKPPCRRRCRLLVSMTCRGSSCTARRPMSSRAERPSWTRPSRRWTSISRQPDKATGAAVLILPGGGYQMLTVPGEGAEPARFFLSRNVAAFVLRYRHGPRYHYPTTLLDAQRALRLIRARAQEYRVDPAKVGVLGGSAGGHLAAMLTTLHDNKLLPEAPIRRGRDERG